MVIMVLGEIGVWYDGQAGPYLGWCMGCKVVVMWWGVYFLFNTVVVCLLWCLSCNPKTKYYGDPGGTS